MLPTYFMLQNLWKTAVWDTSRNEIQNRIDRASLRHDPFRSLTTPICTFCFRIILMVPLIRTCQCPTASCRPFGYASLSCFSLMLLRTTLRSWKGMQGSSSAEPGPPSNGCNQDFGQKWWETLYPDFDAVGLKDKYDFNWYDFNRQFQ